MPLRSGKPYTDTTSATGSASSHQILSSTTMDSTQHNGPGVVESDYEVVADSETERVVRINIFTPEEDLQMPATADEDD